MAERFVVLMDGGFVRKRLRTLLGGPPQAGDIIALVQQIAEATPLAGKVLFRVFFYDAPPFQEQRTHPLTRAVIRYGQLEAARRNEKLLQDLDLSPGFAVRRGTLLHLGWQLTRRATDDLIQASRPLESEDVEPNFQQKQVDIKLGLDIAWIALKGIAESMVVVTGDSDLVPAMKFARKEGVRVFLHTLGVGQRARLELRSHADQVLG